MYKCITGNKVTVPVRTTGSTKGVVLVTYTYVYFGLLSLVLYFATCIKCKTNVHVFLIGFASVMSWPFV